MSQSIVIRYLFLSSFSLRYDHERLRYLNGSFLFSVPWTGRTIIVMNACYYLCSRVKLVWQASHVLEWATSLPHRQNHVTLHLKMLFLSSFRGCIPEALLRDILLWTFQAIRFRVSALHGPMSKACATCMLMKTRASTFMDLHWQRCLGEGSEQAAHCHDYDSCYATDTIDCRPFNRTSSSFSWILDDNC